ncbi:hypothetical protein MMC27_007864 [Xylographa pallens]|nr:hypothetical protein [Xylographa pallens]
MKLLFSSSVLVIAYYLVLGNALPFVSQNHDRVQPKQKRVPYSVVPVDGGSTAPATQAPATVTRTVTQSSESVDTITISKSVFDTLTQTITSTIVINEPAVATTVLLTIASTVTPSISIVNPSQPTETVVIPAVPGPGSLVLSSTIPVSSTLSTSTTSTVFTPFTTASMTSITTSLSSLQASATLSATLNQSQPTISSTTYDNGQWHTTYPCWNATSTTTEDDDQLSPSRLLEVFADIPGKEVNETTSVYQ